ncbi:MAG: hypothetical protein WCQ32_03530 [bacterium]
MFTVNDANGFYTKTGAYNFLKELLGVAKNVLIKKEFFNLFFEEVDGFFKIKKPEEFVRGLFEKNKIKESNFEYHALVQDNQSDKARTLFCNVHNNARALMAA